MFLHMRTTLVIDDRVMTRVKEEAARREMTISELVEAALRAHLHGHERPGARPEGGVRLPTLELGAPLVDISDRDALYQAMEGR